MNTKRKSWIIFEGIRGSMNINGREVEFSLNGPLMYDLEDLAYALCVFVPYDELMDWVEYLKEKAKKWKETQRWEG